MPKCRPNRYVARNLFQISSSKHGDIDLFADRKVSKRYPVNLRAGKAAFGETGQHIALNEPLQHQIDGLPEIPVVVFTRERSWTVTPMQNLSDRRDLEV
jgi:hypothetical protein